MRYDYETRTFYLTSADLIELLRNGKIESKYPDEIIKKVEIEKDY